MFEGMPLHSLSVVVFCLVMLGHNFLFILWLLLYTICHWPTCFAFVTLGLQGLGSNTNGVLWLLPALGSLHLWWNQVHIVKSISYNQLHFCVVLKECFPSLYPNNVNFANKCCSDERYMQFQVNGHLQYKCSTCRGESYQVCVSFIVSLLYLYVVLLSIYPVQVGCCEWEFSDPILSLWFCVCDMPRSRILRMLHRKSGSEKITMKKSWLLAWELVH